MMNKLSFATLTATTILGLATTGCVKQDDPPQAIARAIPTSDQVQIKLPQNQARMLGDVAQYYVTTRDVTRTLNGGTAWVLILIHAIVQQPVTSTSGNVYTWGPGSQALDPAEYKLDVTDNGDGTYDWVLSGRSKTVAGATFEKIIDGHADTTAGELQGNGNFTVDFDAAKRVNPVDSGDAKGNVVVDYDLAARHLDMVAMAPDANGVPAMFTYAYDQADDGGGNMTFNVNANVGGTAAIENVVLRSRWLSDGSGRGDARIAGGDLGATQAIGSECWSNLFRETFYTDNVQWQPTTGAQTDCAFATADLPSL